MKSKTYGKRFSKIKTNSISSDDPPEERREFSKGVTRRPLTNWRTFDNIILGWSETSVTILKKKNLPCIALLTWADVCEQWKTGLPENITPFDACYLSNFIINELGFNHDSTEGLAARVLTIIEQLKTTNIDPLLLAYEFGEITTLLKVYKIESNQNIRNASADRRKRWAIELAEYLVNKNPEISNTKYWDIIPRDDELHHCYRHIKGGKDYLYYSKAGEPDEIITRETFRTEYIAKAKKEHQKNIN